MKRVISFILALVLCLGLVMPFNALAADGAINHDHSDQSDYVGGTGGYVESQHDSDATAQPAPDTHTTTDPSVDIPPVETVNPVQPSVDHSCPYGHSFL